MQIKQFFLEGESPTLNVVGSNFHIKMQNEEYKRTVSCWSKEDTLII